MHGNYFILVRAKIFREITHMHAKINIYFKIFLCNFMIFFILTTCFGEISRKESWSVIWMIFASLTCFIDTLWSFLRWAWYFSLFLNKVLQIMHGCADIFEWTLRKWRCAFALEDLLTKTFRQIWHFAFWSGIMTMAVSTK